MKYVKTTDRLPEKEGKYFVRHIETHEKAIFSYVPTESGWWIEAHNTHLGFESVEWLDESEELSQDVEIEKLKERLIDAREECEKLEERAESAEKSSKEWCTKVIEAAMHRQELQREIERLKTKIASLESPAEMNQTPACMDCNSSISNDVNVPDDIWKKISPKKVDGFKGGGLLCPQCIVNKLSILLHQDLEILRLKKEIDEMAANDEPHSKTNK
jgi:hypothetical protein